MNKIDLPLNENGEIVLPFAGMEVVRFCLDYAVDILFFQDKNYLTLRIENEFTLTRSDVQTKIHPDNLTSIPPVLALFSETVHTAITTQTGNLKITFINGDIIEIEPDVQYEAWELFGGEGRLENLKVVCMPGGDLAIWR